MGRRYVVLALILWAVASAIAIGMLRLFHIPAPYQALLGAVAGFAAVVSALAIEGAIARRSISR
jgi:hypothetical protein